jgi:hypothetical protein
MESDQPKRRGRPPGSRNKPKDRLVPPSTKPLEDIVPVDPDSLVARQLTLLNWAQISLRNEMKKAMQAKGEWISAEDIEKLTDLSQALIRTIDALKKSADLAAELASRMTAEQLLEAAIRKIEGQDVATLNYAIKRLRAHRERIAPVGGMDKIQMGEPATATAAIAELAED